MGAELSTVPLSKYSLRITKGTTPTTLGRGFVTKGINFVKSEAITPDGRIDPSTFAFIDSETHQALSRSILQESDVLFSMAGVYLGKTAVVSSSILPANTNQAVGIIRVDQTKADPRFIHYALSSPSIHNLILRSVAQSAQPNFNLRDIGELPIPNLPLQQQRAIAHVLGTFDDKIELNWRMNGTLEAISRAIFKSWFVDFHPVRAKAEGREPYGMSAESSSHFPKSFQDSPIGKIPKGWRVSPIGENVNAVGGSTPSTEESTFWDGDINFCTPKDMASLQSPVLLDTDRRITDAGLGQISSGLLPRGTVLLSSRAPIGYLAVTEIPVAINQGIIAMICDRELPNLYVLHWAKENMETIVANANGTTFLEISKKNFRPIPVLLPPSNILGMFMDATLPLHRRIVNNLAESNTLARMRDALLPRLISGEIRVKNGHRPL